MKIQLSVVLLLVCSVYLMAQEPDARIESIDGTANVLHSNAKEWRPAKVAMSLNVGDQLFAGKESFIEIRYRKGEIVRMDENTKLVINRSTDKAVKSSTLLGAVWVNMKKLSSQGRSFEMASPTAVASIRGTIFHMNCLPDSTTSVSVFNGKVAVGPADSLKAKLDKEKQAAKGITEVPGPHEVPGPYEVTLDQWKIIVAGQKISVHKDGKFASESFDMKKVDDAFMKKNMALDNGE